MSGPGSQAVLSVYPLSAYTFGQKAAVTEKHGTVPLRMERLKEKYAQEGVRRSVDAVLLVHVHGHPHVLLLQLGSTFFKLPGGRLRPGEDEEAGLLRKLTKALAPESDAMRPDWKVGDLLATYYRPNFENFMYPYCPPHVERPKEIRRVFLLNLPEKCFFSVPKNQKLLAVPLFEVYDHVQRYGTVIAAIPQLLSRYNVRLLQLDGTLLADAGSTPAAAGAVVTPASADQAGDAKPPQASPALPAHDHGALEEQHPPASDAFMVDFDE